MTVKADIVAITPTANAKAVIQAKGADVGVLMQLLQQHAIELQALVKQVIAFASRRRREPDRAEQLADRIALTLPAPADNGRAV